MIARALKIRGGRSRIPLWVLGVSVYLIIAPCSSLLPAIDIGTRMNPIHILVLALSAMLCWRIVFRHRRILRQRAALAAMSAAGMLAATVVLHAQGNLLRYLVLVFPWFVFFVVLLFTLTEPRLPSFAYWKRILFISASIALAASLALYFGSLAAPLPGLAGDVSSLYDRTASVVDCTVGLWLCIFAAHVTPTVASRRAAEQVLCLAVGSLLILLGGFRMFLLGAAIVLLFIIKVRPMRAVRWIPFYAVLAAIILLIAGLPSGIANLPGLRRLTASDQSQSSSWTLHAMEREQEVKIIERAPLFGEGWGIASRYTVGTAETGYLPLYGHSLYTALPARVGLPITIYLFAIALTVMLLGRRTVAKHRSDVLANDVRVSLLGLVVFFVVSSTQNLTSMTQTFPVVAIFIAYIVRRSALLRWRQTKGRGVPTNEIARHAITATGGVNL